METHGRLGHGLCYAGAAEIAGQNTERSSMFTLAELSEPRLVARLAVIPPDAV